MDSGSVFTDSGGCYGLPVGGETHAGPAGETPALRPTPERKKKGGSGCCHPKTRCRVSRYCLAGIVVGSLVFMSISDAEERTFVPFSTVTVA